MHFVFHGTDKKMIDVYSVVRLIPVFYCFEMSQCVIESLISLFVFHSCEPIFPDEDGDAISVISNPSALTKCTPLGEAMPPLTKTPSSSRRCLVKLKVTKRFALPTRRHDSFPLQKIAFSHFLVLINL